MCASHPILYPEEDRVRFCLLLENQMTGKVPVMIGGWERSHSCSRAGEKRVLANTQQRKTYFTPPVTQYREYGPVPLNTQGVFLWHSAIQRRCLLESRLALFMLNGNAVILAEHTAKCLITKLKTKLKRKISTAQFQIMLNSRMFVFSQLLQSPYYFRDYQGLWRRVGNQISPLTPRPFPLLLPGFTHLWAAFLSSCSRRNSPDLTHLSSLLSSELTLLLLSHVRRDYLPLLLVLGASLLLQSCCVPYSALSTLLVAVFSRTSAAFQESQAKGSIW